MELYTLQKQLGVTSYVHVCNLCSLPASVKMIDCVRRFSVPFFDLNETILFDRNTGSGRRSPKTNLLATVHQMV